MKKIFSLALVLLLIISAVGCKGVNNKDKYEGNPSNYGLKHSIAFVCNFFSLADNGDESKVQKSINLYCSENNSGIQSYHPQSDEDIYIVNSIETAILDGAEIVVVVGDTYGDVALSIVEQYKNTTFIVYNFTNAKASAENFYVCKAGDDFAEFLSKTID